MKDIYILITKWDLLDAHWGVLVTKEDSVVTVDGRWTDIDVLNGPIRWIRYKVKLWMNEWLVF